MVGCIFSGFALDICQLSSGQLRESYPYNPIYCNNNKKYFPFFTNSSGIDRIVNLNKTSFP